MESADFLFLPPIDADAEVVESGDENHHQNQPPDYNEDDLRERSGNIVIIPVLPISSSSEDGVMGSNSNSFDACSNRDEQELLATNDGEDETFFTDPQQQQPKENNYNNSDNKRQTLISTAALVLLHHHDTFSSSSGVGDGDSLKLPSGTESDAGSNTSRNKSPTAEISAENTNGNNENSDTVNLEILNNSSVTENPAPVAVESEPPIASTPTNQTIIIVDLNKKGHRNDISEEETIEFLEITEAEPTEITEPEQRTEPTNVVSDNEDDGGGGEGDYLGKSVSSLSPNNNNNSPRQLSASPQPQEPVEEEQLLTIETHSSSYNGSPRADSKTSIHEDEGVKGAIVEANNAEDQEPDSHLKRHLQSLQRVPFGKSRAEICRNCTCFDEAVARTQRDAVFSDQQMWRNLQFVIREKYTSFAKLEAISRIQEKIQELVAFVDSSVLTNCCWSSGNKLLPATTKRSSTSSAVTKELPEDLGIMLQQFNGEMEASTALSNWLTESIESTCRHLENAAKFYQFECELGHCYGWMGNSLETTSNKLDQLVETGYCNWLQKTAHHDEMVNNSKHANSSVPTTVAASDWLAASFREIENCAKLLNFWQEKVDRLFVTCRRLSPVNKRSPTQRGIYTPADVTFSTPSPYYSSPNASNTSCNNSSVINSNNSSGSTPLVPARILLDYNNNFTRGNRVNVSRMNSGRSAELPHYWSVEKTSNNNVTPSCDLPNYVCELVPSDTEMQERQDVVAEIAGMLITSGRKVLKSLHNFVVGFIRANFPALDEQRASLLMGLELGEKLDSLNVIDETLHFVEKALPSNEAKTQEIVQLLSSYRAALLNERKTGVNSDDYRRNSSTRSALLVTNVEILKQLLGKTNQLDAYWDAFAKNISTASKVGEQTNKQEEEDESTPISSARQRSVANWYKLIDLEPDENEAVVDKRPIILPISVNAAVQTEEISFSPPDVKPPPEPLPVAQVITSERPSSSSSSSASTESDMVVQSELAEERRRLTIKGIVRNLSNPTDLMSLREAITRGIVDPTSGTYFDRQHPQNEPIPIPVAIQRGFIIVEHQSEAEVVRREQKTEHVVISRAGSKRWPANARPLPPPPPPRVEAQQPEKRATNGTTVFVSDNDTVTPVVTTVVSNNRNHDSNSTSPSNLVVPPPPSYMFSVSPTAVSPKSFVSQSTSTPTTRPTSTSPIIITKAGSNSSPSSSNNSSRPTSAGPCKLITMPGAIMKPTVAITTTATINNNKAVLIHRDKNNKSTSPTTTTFVASTYVGDDNNNQQSNKQQQQQQQQQRTSAAMTLLVKKLEQDLVLRTAPPGTLEPVTTTITGTGSSTPLSSVINQQQKVSPPRSANLSPNQSKTPPPVLHRSQVGARGSVRKIAKFFEQK